MVVLQNDLIRAEINERGAELKSLTCNGTEYIWQSHAEVWPASCPLLFPICGGLKDDKYRLNGKEYTLAKHGYARFKTFTVESQSDDSAVFLSTEDEETLTMFPFRYELRVEYRLSGSSLEIAYRVNNNSDETMYFSIGSHEGYATPEGIEDYDVIFPEKETLSARLLNGNLLGDQYVPVLKDSNVLPLYDKYFTVDALVFTTLQSRSATLRNRKTGKAIRVDFPGKDYFLLWHKHGAGFICMEPWTGIPDTIHSTGEITEKETITALNAGEEFYRAHTLTVVE